MKKLLLLFVLALGFSAFSYGQFALGVKLGYNGTKLTTNIDSIKSNFNSGFHIGAWAHLGKRLYFAPEFLYSMSGSVFTKEGKLSTQNWKQKITVGSIDIPLILGFKVIHSGAITWRLELGPEISFVVNKKVSDEGSTSVPPITTDNIKDANWYVLGGTGIDVLFLTFDVRYKYGLSQLITDVNNYTLSTNNSQLLISVGFRIFGSK
jgi:hypothetical protein